EQQLQSAYHQSDLMMQQIPGWFDQYRAQLQNIQQREADAFNTAVGQIGQLGQNLNTAAAQSAAADQAQQQASAAIRGATADPEAYQRAIQAQQVNARGLDAQGTLMAQLGFTGGQMFRNQEAIAGRQGIQELLNEQ